MTDITRRSFLTGAAVATGVFATEAAALGLTGCSTKTDTPVTDQATTEASVDYRQFAIDPVNVADAGTPIRECDYLIIGAGNCGMMSAAAAGELGLKVIVLEKASVTSGSSVGTEVTQAYNDCKILQEYADDPDVVNVSQETGTYQEIYTYLMMHTSWQSNGQLVANYVKNNHEAHDLLYAHGGYPMMLLPSLDAPTNGIMYQDQGEGAHQIMEKAAVEAGAEILLEAPATRLVVDDSGTVMGAMATIDGAEAYVAAKATFVGTGGFSGNAEMGRAFIPWYDIAVKRDAHIPHDGDGIRMLFGIGGVPSDMQRAQPAACSVPGVTWDTAIDRAAREPYLWVGESGDRIGNEKWNVMDNMYGASVREPNHFMFNVIDTAAAERMQTKPLFTNARTVLGSNEPDPAMIEELEKGVQSGDVFKGDTIAELADAAGINPERLEATVATYNAACEAGQDEEFWKPVDYLFPIQKAPFYAFKLVPSWYSTLNGVKINGSCQVVNASGLPVPGVYAGGLDSGEFYKYDYNHGFSGGCSGYSYFTGCFAAQQAKAYIDTL